MWVVDPRRTTSARFADVWLGLDVGTDIALALEDMRFTTMSGEEIWMRGDDHQIMQSLHISRHTDQGVEFDADNSGFGLITEYSVPMQNTIPPVKCEMDRPRR